MKLINRHQLGQASLIFLCVGLLDQAHAAPVAAWEGCSVIPADAERLACYDRLVGPPPPEPVPQAADKSDTQPVVAQAASAEPKLLSTLSRHWELDDEAKQGAFLFRPHHPNYFLPIKYSNAPNNSPYKDTFTQPDLGLDSIETELQLSFKIKAMEGVFGHDNLDLWLGYTITSFWQAYNGTISSPFRETNYEPEAMLVFRTNYELAGFRGRFINLGMVHQSNGRGETLSRSWNRVYAQFGFERDNLAVMIRPWVRIPENNRSDDNPDIEDYMGHGDVLAVYRKGRNAYSLLLRNNLKSSDNRGALKLNWSFPLVGRLKGYVQYFNGYGESLVDYNYKQQSLGFGVSLTEGM
ncbi:MAG: phospholipase [Sulfuriferula multivorans]|uniref:Phospholipase A1 n=1 Tax=Sulfuriferula multivorans TaxID=1559896 RepID=A0A7C9JW69_9PROT|nr:phospholipase [Sulfuriferula multivorans]